MSNGQVNTMVEVEDVKSILMVSVWSDWEKDLEFFIPEFFPVIKKYDNIHILADTPHRLIIGYKNTALDALKLISKMQILYKSLVDNTIYIKGHVKVNVAVYDARDASNITL